MTNEIKQDTLHIYDSTATQKTICGGTHLLGLSRNDAAKILAGKAEQKPETICKRCANKFLKYCKHMAWAEVTGPWRGWAVNDHDRFEAYRAQTENIWWKIELLDMWAETGDESGDRFHVEVERVDLTEVPEKELQSAIQSCGWQGMGDEDGTTPASVKAECLFSYGLAAPMWQQSGSREAILRKAARDHANEFMLDADKVEEALDRPVNAIGSTARDFGRGQIMAGLTRYAEDGAAGSTTKDLMLKLHGVDHLTVMRHHRREDPLAWMFGFMGRWAEIKNNDNAPMIEDWIKKEDKRNKEGGGLAPAAKNGAAYADKVKAKTAPWPRTIKPVPKGYEIEKLDGE